MQICMHRNGERAKSYLIAGNSSPECLSHADEMHAGQFKTSLADSDGWKPGERTKGKETVYAGGSF